VIGEACGEGSLVGKKGGNMAAARKGGGGGGQLEKINYK
jgi:hypothetical protein